MLAAILAIVTADRASLAQSPQDLPRQNTQRTQQDRQAAWDQAEVWRQKRLEVYRRRLRAEEIGVPDHQSKVVTAYEDELGVPAGTYEIDLEDGGTVAVNVTRPTAAERLADQLRRVNLLAAQIQENLERLQFDFYRGEGQLFRDLVFAIDKARGLTRQAAVGESAESVTVAFTAFEEAWNGVALRLRQSPLATPAALERIDNLRRLTDAIARTLDRPSALEFDRIRAAGLVSSLADVMQRTSEPLSRDATDLRLAVCAVRAHQQAEELRDAIYRHHFFPTVLRAYREWQRAWAALAQLAEQFPEWPEAMTEKRMEQIRSLDRRLYAELRLAPAYEGSLTAIAADLVATAEFLARELREEEEEGDAVLLADEFALAAGDIHRSLSGEAGPVLRERDVDRMDRKWGALRRALDDSNHADARDSRQAAEMIEALLADLRGRLMR